MKIPPMNPLVLSALHGLIAGVISGGKPDKKRAFTNFGAPIAEEALFRGLGSSLPFGVTSTAFAAAHVLKEKGYSRGSDVVRFGDVLLGGLLYETAFKRFGIMGAIAAHTLHNVMAGLGQRLR